MEKVFFSGIILLLLVNAAVAGSSSTSGSIIIAEVLYDPVNESGGEAVELYNPTGESVGIGGWLMATESSSADATIPQGTILLPGSYYLIADSGWSFNNPGVLADYEEALTLANNDAGIALINNGTVIDAVGWGNPLNIGSGLFKGTPAAQVSEGQSLRRLGNGSGFANTNNNSADFIAGVPSFMNSSSSAGFGIDVYAVISGSAPSVDSINISDDDAILPGIQLIPLPKQNRSVNVRAVVRGFASSNEISGAVVRINSGDVWMQKAGGINLTSDIYEANITMPFYYAAGNYTLNITAFNNFSMSHSLVSSFEYLSLMSVEIDSRDLRFAALPGGFAEVNGDLNMSSSDKVTIRNTGNTAVNFQISGTNLTSADKVISAGNIQYSFDSSYDSALAGSLSYSRQSRAVNLSPGMNAVQQLSFRLNVPATAFPGNYSGRIFVAATS
ncbi:lamin tail domain-containing protein [Candidatus Woesearchaeota archaeon]|nr:lamin tail domain-containing protein [Candidatus Woesearchaeota archaeon]